MLLQIGSVLLLVFGFGFVIFWHELGHFLGSVHSPEADSVMRPVLGDRQSRSVKFRVGFDPV